MTDEKLAGWTSTLRDLGGKTPKEREQMLTDAAKRTGEMVARQRAHAAQQRIARIFGLAVLLGIMLGVHFGSWPIGIAVFSGAMLWKT